MRPMSARTRRSVAALAALLLLPALATLPARALTPGPGDLDPTFAGGFVELPAHADGTRSVLRATTQDGDGRTYLGGYADSDGRHALEIARLTPQGALDTTFGGDGRFVACGTFIPAGCDAGPLDDVNSRILGLDVDAGGRPVALVATDIATGPQPARVARFTDAGALDPTFGDGDGLADLPTSFSTFIIGGIDVDPAGRIVVVGQGSSLPVARLTPTGEHDLSFGGGDGVSEFATPGELGAVVTDPAGRIWVAGRDDEVPGGLRSGGEQIPVVGRMAADGTPDEAFTGEAARAAGTRLLVNGNGVTGGQGRGRGIAIAPDGGAYVSGDTTVFAGEGGRDIPALWHVDDADIAQLEPHPAVMDFTAASPGFYSDVAVQPDGKVVLAGSARTIAPSSTYDVIAERRIAGGSETDGAFGLQRITFGDGGVHEVAEDVVLQPDGRIVVGAGTDRLGALRLLGDSPQLPVSDGRIAFERPDGSIWAMGESGEGLVALTGPGSDGHPSFFPGGDRIAFESSRSEQGEIYVAGADGTGAVAITGDPVTEERDPAVAPDGSRVAMSSTRGGSYGIWTSAPDGSDLRQLTDGGGMRDVEPAWSPDGTAIAFLRRNADGMTAVWTVPSAGGAAAPLFEPTAEVRSIAWGPAGIAAVLDPDIEVSGDESIVLVDPSRADTRPVTLLAVGVVGAVDLAWAPDGRRLALAGPVLSDTTGVSGEGVWVLDAAAGPSSLVRLASGEADMPTWTSSLSVSASTAAVAASPSKVPVGDVPLQTQAPAVQSAPVLDVPIVDAPVLDVPIVDAPVLDVPIVDAPVLDVPIVDAPVLDVPIVDAPFGFDSLADPADLGSSALVRAGVDAITLASLPIRSGPDWATRLAGTPLAGRPLQATTLREVLSLDPRPALPSLAQIDLGASPLGRLSTMALLLGDLRLDAIAGVDWCAALEGLGHGDCGAALGVAGDPRRGRSASLVSLQVAGVPVGAIAGLSQVRMGQVAFGGDDVNPLPFLRVATIALADSSLGGIRIADVPAADRSSVVACDTVDCSDASTVTLAGAQAAQAVRPAALIRDLGPADDHLPVLEVVLGLFAGIGGDPYDMPPAELGVLGYGGEGSSSLAYRVTYAPPGDVAAPEVSLELPADFRAIPGTSRLLVGDGEMASEHALPEPTATPSGGGSSLVLAWQLAGVIEGHAPLRLLVDVRPGLTLGDAHARAAVSAVGASATAATQRPTAVTETFEAGDGPGQTTAIQPGVLHYGFVSRPGDVDRFTVQVPQAGSQVAVFLTSPGFDADVVLYHPSSAKPHVPLRPAAGTSLVPIEDQAVGLSNLGEPLIPEAADDIPIDDLPVAATSTDRGAASEDLVALSWPADDPTYTVQVSGYNGAHGPSAYGLRVAIIPPAGLPAGSPRSFPSDGTATVAPLPTTLPVTGPLRTAILVSETRLQRAYGTTRAKTATDALAALAASPEVAGVVVKVDGWADVREAYARWDEVPSDPERANDVVRLINTRVDALFGARRSELRHVVIAGTDELVPMARIPDLTRAANERTFAQALVRLAESTGGNNALLGALASGSLLTDDPYGDLAPQPWLGTYLYVPELATGRLVETPEDMARVIAGFLEPAVSSDPDGTLRPSAHLTTGYDFMSDLAEQMSSSLAQAAGSATATALIEDGSAGSAWDRDDLAAAFTEASPAPDIVALNAHFGPTVAEPADRAAGLFRSPEVAPAEGGGPDLARRLLISIGCHSGFSISDFLAGSSASALDADWPQAFAARGAGAFVGQTGFGLGLQDLLGFSERLLAGYAERVDQGTLGEALVAAKQQYLATAPPNVYDAKVMAQATYFGLPAFRLANQEMPAPAPAGPAIGTDAATGLPAAEVGLHAPAGGSRWNKITEDGRGSYYVLDGQEPHVVHHRPVQPRTQIELTSPGSTARGVLITDLGSVDEPGFDPLLARPVVDLAAHEPEVQFGDTAFPTRLAHVSSWQAPTGPRQQLVIVPGQLRSTSGPTEAITGVQRRFTDVDATVFYAPAGSTDVEPATFSFAEGAREGSLVRFTARVADDEGEVLRVVALHRSPGTGDWAATEMARALDGSWIGATSVPGAGDGDEVEFFLQAVDAGGNVAVTANKARNFLTARTTFSPSDAIGIVIAGTPVAGWYTGATTVTFNGPEGTTFDVSVDGGAAQTYGSGSPVPVSGDGGHVVSYVASSGESGSVIVPIDGSAPLRDVTRPEAGSPIYLLGSSATASYRCSDPLSGLASCAGTVADGAPLATSSPGLHAFSVTAADRAGNSATTERPYWVRYQASGTCAGGPGHQVLQPVNKDGSSVFKHGSTIPVKFRVCDANGKNIGPPVMAASAPKLVGTSATLTLSINEEALSATPDTAFRWTDDEHWQFNHKTSNLQPLHRYTYEIRLNDGSTIRYSFSLK